LQKAADRRLGIASEKLADLLLEKAEEGKVESTRMLVTLAEHRRERKPLEKKKKKRHGGLCLADLPLSEPEWKQPEPGDVWVGDGWRKQGTGEFVRECEPVDEWYEGGGSGGLTGPGKFGTTGPSD
jgi:hypothetical protein